LAFFDTMFFTLVSAFTSDFGRFACASPINDTILIEMGPPSAQHRRTHNLLLISKLLNQRDAASPFTLVIDSLEQSAKPLIAEQIKRANVRAKQVVIQ
jgi:hypothetical protein